MDKSIERAAGLGIGIFFVVLIVSGILGAAVVGTRGSSQRYDELFKFWLTLIQVGGLGGIAALVLERYKQGVAAARLESEKQDAKRTRADEQSRQVFFEARKAYDTLKRTRRLLQDELKLKHPTAQQLAAALGNPQTATSLMTHGRALFDPQLLFESLDEQAQHSIDLPRDTNLADCFRRMEKRANEVSDALRASPALNTDQLKAVSDFLDSANFGRDFKVPYHEAIRILLGRA